MPNITGLMRLRKSKDQETPWEINLTIDFDGCSSQDLHKWAYADRKIAFQKVARDLPDEALDRMAVEGVTIHASRAATKPQTVEEAVAAVKSMPKEAREAILASLME